MKQHKRRRLVTLLHPRLIRCGPDEKLPFHLLLPHFLSQVHALVMDSEVVPAAKTFPAFLTLMSLFTLKTQVLDYNTHFSFSPPEINYQTGKWHGESKGTLNSGQYICFTFLPQIPFVNESTLIFMDVNSIPYVSSLLLQTPNLTFRCNRARWMKLLQNPGVQGRGHLKWTYIESRQGCLTIWERTWTFSDLCTLL